MFLCYTNSNYIIKLKIYQTNGEFMVKIVDLFAGCGGLSLGFQYGGFDVVAGFEFWEIAAACYEKNFDHPIYRTDLSDVETATKQIKEIAPDIIIGGPPCQDFSQAGKRIEATRASLTSAYAQIIANIKPKFFVMENVDRAAQSDNYSFARNLLKEAGYGLTEIILDACHCGVPQKRKRFFCIGSLSDSDGFLDEYFKNHISEKETTLRDYFGNALDFTYYYRHPRNYSRRAIFSIDEPAPTMRGVNRPVPKGYPGHPNDACPLDENIRALTTLERSLIQTFPPNYKWMGNKTETEQMIGNAVPVKLAEFVARALQFHIKSKSSGLSPSFDQFKLWLEDNQQYSNRTISDILSRLKRANAILPIPENIEPVYLFNLDNDRSFNSLSVNVKSQIRKAVNLYLTCCG